ncbi:pyrroline-5-carboxylate reductase [Salinarchaeum sp. Harcht-Bsk1]|uniref:pyrroline-5-carboxylate reductase n=1 Tax=Salinarchaeum sp. Harcht-Bsk1 TaxID=1333523 RepID=UPI000677E3FA|nr:pyrroline-5-carboxylate reductase [Salinarchaeum sp. Harcht-Bsk1]
MARASVIGCGNMGSALVRGLAQSGDHTVIAYDVDEEALASVSEYSTETTTDLDVATASDIVFVVVKPDIAPGVVEELDLDADQTLVSFAAGVSTDVIEPLTDATVLRVMPNLAAATGNMAAAVTGGELTPEIEALLEEAGVFVEVDEEYMDIATAVNGSGPAFVFYLIQAMQQAGEDAGLDTEDAQVLAAQTFKGAAETVLRSDEPIEDLIDAVCSPNGTTIEGMDVLWNSDVDEELAAAVAAAERRSRELAAESSDA